MHPTQQTRYKEIKRNERICKAFFPKKAEKYQMEVKNEKNELTVFSISFPCQN